MIVLSSSEPGRISFCQRNVLTAARLHTDDLMVIFHAKTNQARRCCARDSSQHVYRLRNTKYALTTMAVKI